MGLGGLLRGTDHWIPHGGLVFYALVNELYCLYTTALSNEKTL